MIKDNFATYEKLIKKSIKPSRYIGSEWGSVSLESKKNATFRAVMVYPDTYEIGQANKAVSILYKALNSDSDIFCERSYLPWTDMIDYLRQENLPLFTLESATPINELDFVGITLPHELCATNILEFLDLSRIPVLAKDRSSSEPIIYGGGSCVFNPLPFEKMFDVFFVGEGEDLDLKAAQIHNKLKKEGASRLDILKAISALDGVYVPAIHADCKNKESNFQITKNIISEFDSASIDNDIIVPFCETVQDRLSIEIMRGCSRGCRFCQAGAIYRPVREKKLDSIIKTTLQGLKASGYDEVSLMSLSTTDYSNIEQLLRRLNCALKDKAVQVSIPSQRVDSLDISLAQLIAGTKKGSMTLAPEAGSQKMRNVINKNLNEQNILDATFAAFNGGWKRIKLYFMIGLPFEQDCDVRAIGELCNKILRYANENLDKDKRNGIGLSVSCSIFIPKPSTPFQFMGQISKEEATHKIKILKESFKDKRIDFHYHESKTSLIEACIARGDETVFDLIYLAWKNGAKFDAWSDQFNWQAWVDAQSESKIALCDFATKTYDINDVLPWDFISCGLDKEFLISEYNCAKNQTITQDCTFTTCTNCGVCQNLQTKLSIDAGKRSI